MRTLSELTAAHGVRKSCQALCCLLVKVTGGREGLHCVREILPLNRFKARGNPAKNPLNKIKNSFKELIKRLETAKQRVHDMKDRSIGIILIEAPKGKRMAENRLTDHERHVGYYPTIAYKYNYYCTRTGERK